ncbi:MAG: hypothetical protein GTN76_00760 [Candidatus Aenigmarchaeota archaeon]|nr:hypothetical protein [Candidatus Aenigmarchaeota archaeon]
MNRDVLGFGGILILFLMLLVFIPPIMAETSSHGTFTVTPDFIYINWTNGTINLTSNSDNLTVFIENSSTQVFSNYSQYNRYQIGNYDNLNDTSWNLCFNSTPGGSQNLKFRVQDETLAYTNTSTLLNETNTTFFYLTPYVFCPPGKYYGYFYVKNVTNQTENLTINVSFQIPIDEQNTFNATTNTGFFKGATVSNYGYYHSYYFDTALTQNLTKLTLTLGPSSSNDVDVFLYDSSGNFLAKSINRSSSLEELLYDVPGASEMYEIRVYGNVSANYQGYLYFSTLNITDTSGAELSSVGFGELDANGSSSDQVIVLRNEDDQVLTNVMERKEVYHVDSWLNQNTDKTFQLLVPDFAEKVKIRLEWGQDAGENVTNWTLYLRDSRRVLVETSNGKYINANKTTGSSVLEEYIEYGNAGTFTESNDGFWNVTVKNQSLGSANLNDYNLTAYIYAPNSWLTTNYSTTTLNSSGVGNYTRAVNVNVTTPETNVLNGSYEGFLEYYQASKWKVRLPISFNVRTGTLIVDENISVTSRNSTHNIGFNTVSAPLLIKIPYNNTGGYPLYVSVENTTGNRMYQIGNNSNYVDFFLSDFPTGPINPGTSGFLNVSVQINTTNTHDIAGLYRGFVLLNTTNSTNVTRQSSLFKTFNVTLYTNLTNKIDIIITSINPDLLHPPTSPNNITFGVSVKLVNGTVISDNNLMSYNNFTQIKINETNVTGYGHVLTNIISGAAGGGTGCQADPCYINGTVPANSIGGQFNVYVAIDWNTKMFGGTGINLTGVGTTNNFKINDTGVYLTAISAMSFGQINEGTQNLYFNMTVKNYGPLKVYSPKGRVYFHEGGCTSQLTTIVKDYAGSCFGNPSKSSNASGAYLDYELNPFHASGCWIRFELDVSNISTTNKSCYFTVTSTNKKSHGDLEDIYMLIKEVSTGDGNGDEDGNGAGGGDECSSDSDCTDAYECSAGVCKAVTCTDGFVSDHKCNPYEKTLSITDYESKVSVVQGDSVTTEIGVKNTGNTALDVKLDITHNVTGVTQTITPSAYNIDPDETYSFTVKFTLTNTTKVGNHPITVKAHEKDDEDISATKTITLSVEPLEATKKEINQTYDNYKVLFETLKSRFLAIQPATVSDVNFTKTNRTYGSLLNMLTQIEGYLSNNQYADAADVLEDMNATLVTFEAQINQLLSEGSIFGALQLGGIWTWVAIAVVIVVIVVFLVYLLLPPKKGYHPVYGYRGPAKNPIIAQLNKIKEKIKGIGGGAKKPSKEQTTLSKFEKQPVQPAPQPPSKPAYMEGYKRTETYPYKESLADKLKKKVKKE